VMVTVAPIDAAVRAMCFPIPEEAPVTNMFF
jgi:hypothetical protein